jgi:ribosomal-protein-alanine N-acetyltransferase
MNQRHILPMVELEKRCFSTPFSVSMLENEYNNPDSFYFVDCLLDGTIRGYAGFQAVLDEGHIINIAVAPEWRRQGIARALLDYIIIKARDLDLGLFFLEVRDGNRSARRLYEAFGFEYTGKRKAYYTSPCEDALLMTLTL